LLRKQAFLGYIGAMTVTLTPEQEKFVAEQLKSGHYQSAGDIIAQGLGMLQAQEDFIRTNAAELRVKIAVGMEQVRSGKVVDGRTAIQTVREKLRRRESGGK
jgi:antitoxin ParD1/3/4